MTQFVECLTCNWPVVKVKTIKSYHCYLEQGTIYALLTIPPSPFKMIFIEILCLKVRSLFSTL